MIQYPHIRQINRFITVMLTLFLSVNVHGQTKDSITYNSTCTNYKIQFSCSIFEMIQVPDKVIWNFGDPASGYYNTAGTKYPTHAFASPGIYHVSVAVVTFGDTTTVDDSIKIVSPVAYNFGPDIFLCEKGDTIITGPTVPGASYLWNDDSATTTPSLHISKSGEYALKIDGCPVSDSIGVYFSETPKIKLGDDHVLCANEILTLNATTQNGNYTWKLNGTALPDTTGQLRVVDPGGQYIVTAVVPGCGTFSDTANITFASLPAPPFSLGPDTLLCPKQIYPLTASVAGATAYKWNTDATDSMIQVTSPDVYYAFVTVSGQCQVVDSVEVKYRGDKNLDFHDTAVCKGSTLILNADFGTGTYNWVSDPPQRNDQNQTGQSTYYVYQPGMYKVVASVGQCVYTDSLRVRFDDSLKVSIGGDTSLCIGEEYILHAKTNADTIYWQDLSTTPDYLVTGPGTYTLVAQNGCGVDTVSVKIDMRHCECELTVPNAFTPNGDGVNETFRPLHPCKMSGFIFKIFDRYGELVFQSDDFSKGWDGLFHGTKAVSGTYVWMASYINSDTNQKKYKKGFVVLIR